MALGGEIDNGAGLMFGEQTGDEAGIANVALHKTMTRVTLQAGQILKVARVGQRVEIDDRFFAPSQPVEYEI